MVVMMIVTYGGGGSCDDDSDRWLEHRNIVQGTNIYETNFLGFVTNTTFNLRVNLGFPQFNTLIDT